MLIYSSNCSMKVEPLFGLLQLQMMKKQWNQFKMMLK